MYDMYPWDSAGQGEYPPQPLRSVRNPARNPARRAPKSRDGSALDGSAPDGSAPDGSALDGRALNGHARDISPAQAVQIALDRRDNGGEGRPASRAATSPAASQARQ
ncbi:MAG TPA: hypothetical protein VFV73_27195 [Streptosporangiaceae bacterium]|nr:hypothetical protein [Streptosporangiaceae bacterium]